MPVAYMVWAEQRAIETIGSTHISHSDMHMNTPDFSVVRKTSFLCLDRLELFPPLLDFVDAYICWKHMHWPKHTQVSASRCQYSKS